MSEPTTFATAACAERASELGRYDSSFKAELDSRREFIDYKTSMITDSDPLRGLLFY